MWDGLCWHRVCVRSGGGVDLGVRPARGQCRQRVLGHLGRLETCGLSVKAWARDGRLFARPSLGDGCLGALQRGLRLDDQPALGHAIVAELKTLSARVVISRVPGVPQRWRDHLRDRVQGVGIRVIQPRGWRLEAWSPWESVASALRSRGLGAF